MIKNEKKKIQNHNKKKEKKNNTHADTQCSESFVKNV